MPTVLARGEGERVYHSEQQSGQREGRKGVLPRHCQRRKELYIREREGGRRSGKLGQKGRIEDRSEGGVVSVAT